MSFVALQINYLKWHFGESLLIPFVLIKRFNGFLWKFFAITPLASTILFPWKKLGEKSKPGFHPAEFLSNTIIDLILIIIGFSIKGAIIIIGVMVMAIVNIVGLILAAAWAILPIIIPVLFFAGAILIIF